MSEEKVILEINSISKSYSRNIKNKDNDVISESNELLHNIDLKLNHGQITALIGGNGSGKTTLFNIISGFTYPDSGEIVFYNGTRHNLTKLAPYEISRLGIGRMFQEVQVFPELSVLENMLVADQNSFGVNPIQALFRIKKIRETENGRANKAIEIIRYLFGDDSDLIKFQNSSAKNLSYGQQRLLGLARLFMADNKLILLDEPTSGVNPNLHFALSSSIKKIVANGNKSVFLIDHNMPFVENIADYCAFIHEGKISEFGTANEIINSGMVKANYLGL